MTRAKEELWVMRFRRSELTSRFASSLFPKPKEEVKKAAPLSPRAVPDLVPWRRPPGAVSRVPPCATAALGPKVVSRSGDIVSVCFADGVERRFSLTAPCGWGSFSLRKKNKNFLFPVNGIARLTRIAYEGQQTSD